MDTKTEDSNIEFVQKHPNAAVIPILSKKTKSTNNEFVQKHLNAVVIPILSKKTNIEPVENNPNDIIIPISSTKQSNQDSEKNKACYVADYKDVLSCVYKGEYHKISSTWENDSSRNYNLKANNIPLSVHLIWLTKGHQPSEMKPKMLDDLKHNIELLNADQNKWQFNIWMHDQTKTPETVKFCQNIVGCNIREINELTNYEQIKNTINTLINSNLYSLAKNIISSAIIKNYGGMYYTNLNFSFQSSPVILHHYFDFYSIYDKNNKFIQILAAKPMHPIIINYHEMILTYLGIEKNSNLPYYPNNIISYKSTVNLVGGLVCLASSYRLYNNLYNNNDIIFSSEIIGIDKEAGVKLLIDSNQVVTSNIAEVKVRHSEELPKVYINLKDDTILSPQNKELCNQQQYEFGVKYAIDKVIKSANNLICRDNNIIEFISHRAWLTNPDNPTFLKKEVLKISQRSINTLDNSGKKWTHYWWALKDEHFTPEMRQMFNKNNIMLKTVDELYPFYPGLEKAIATGGKLSYSLSVDIIKWLVVYHYGGLYTDIDYKFTSTKVLNKLHHCSEIYFSHWMGEGIQNAILASKKGNLIAQNVAKESIRLLVEEPNKFESCPKNNQIELMNIYGYVKPFTNLILSEQVDAASVILLPSALMVDKSDKCLTFEYGPIQLTSLGFDYRFNTWKSDNSGETNTQRMDAYAGSSNDENELELGRKDFCDKVTHLSLKDNVIPTPKDKNFCSQGQDIFGIKFAIEKVLKLSDNLTCLKDAQIEFISHRVWVTNPDNPTIPKKEILELVLNSISKLDSSENEWDHYWWVLKDNHYSDEMKTMFASSNIVLKTVDELYPFYPNLESAILNANKIGYVLAADLVRWVVLYHFGGLYLDIDYKVTSTKVLHNLHHCSEIYLCNDGTQWILNGLIGSKKGNLIAGTAVKEYTRVLIEEQNKFQHCSLIDQMFNINVYGHVEPFINLILSEQVDASSVILVPMALMVDKSDKCLTFEYGPIQLTSLGFDYRFNTWKSDTAGKINTQNMDSYISSESDLPFIGDDLCG